MKNILFSSIMAGHKNSTQKKKVKKKKKKAKNASTHYGEENKDTNQGSRS